MRGNLFHDAGLFDIEAPYLVGRIIVLLRGPLPAFVMHEDNTEEARRHWKRLSTLGDQREPSWDVFAVDLIATLRGILTPEEKKRIDMGP